MPRCENCGDYISEEEMEETGLEVCEICKEDYEEEDEEDHG